MCTSVENGRKRECRSSDQSGFTLVELMIVVGILSILTTVALPSYVRFQAKARQSEARLALASVYTLQTTFQIDQNTFTSCLSDAGYERSSQASYYSVGLVDPSSLCGDGTEDCHLQNFMMPTVCNAGVFPAGAYFPASKGADGRPVNRSEFVSAASGTVMAQNQFTIAAVGSVTTAGSRRLDVWTVNQHKQIVNLKPGF